MSEIQLYQFPVTGQEIRVVVRDGEPWFIARDVSAVLGLANGRMAVGRLDDDEKGVISIDTPGGQQQVAIISEAGLYDLIVRSDKREAKPFRRWVTHDILPSLRKTGHYSVDPANDVVRQLPTTYVEALRELADTVEQRDQAQAQLAIAAPKADAWEVLASATGDYSVREAAYILNRDPNISTGQNRLFDFMKELKVIDRWKRPYQTHDRHVRLRPLNFRKPFADADSGDKQVRVTVEGLRYLHKKLGGTAPISSLLDPAAAARPPEVVPSRHSAPEALFELEASA